MIERKVIPAVAALMSDKELAKVIEGYMFSLRWRDTEVNTSDLRELRRFGIDIEKADSSAGKQELFDSICSIFFIYLHHNVTTSLLALTPALS
jgi:hypothetical protein